MSKQKCRQTVLAPTYAGPINRMMMLPQSESGYLVYSTREKVWGEGFVSFALNQSLKELYLSLFAETCMNLAFVLNQAA